jgi:hypothetical protein
MRRSISERRSGRRLAALSSVGGDARTQVAEQG